MVFLGELDSVGGGRIVLRFAAAHCDNSQLPDYDNYKRGQYDINLFCAWHNDCAFRCFANGNKSV
jgi:hypothetical protein